VGPYPSPYYTLRGVYDIMIFQQTGMEMVRPTVTTSIININADYGNKHFPLTPTHERIVTFAYNVQDGTNGITIAITNIGVKMWQLYKQPITMEAQIGTHEHYLRSIYLPGSDVKGYH